MKKGDKYCFAQDYQFNSSSQAGSMVKGYNVPGPDVWKDENGITLKEHQERRKGEQKQFQMGLLKNEN